MHQANRGEVTGERKEFGVHFLQLAIYIFAHGSYQTLDTRIQEYPKNYLTEDILEDKVCSVRLQLGERSKLAKAF